MWLVEKEINMQQSVIILNLLLFIILTTNGQEIEHKICSPKGLDDACQQLGRTHELACRTNAHNVDCLLNIENNISHIGRINSEEAFLGANLVSNNIQVIGEIHSTNHPSEIVVLVRNTIGDNIVNLKGKRFCHPGFTHDNLSPSLIQELENQIIETIDNFCINDNTTLIEKHIRGISGFFGDSCRPGVWTEDTTLDQLLKHNYSNLCKLCDSQNCNSYYKAPFNDSLKCLNEKQGDIAITTIHEALLFMNNTNNAQNFKYFCKNGTSTGLVPCIWSKQLHNLIVAEKDAINFVGKFLRQHLGNRLLNESNMRTLSDMVVHQALVSILKLQPQESIKLITNYETKSLQEYVRERRQIPNLTNTKRCDLSLRWCTKSDIEQTKCEWLSQAALNRQIQPIIECIQTQYNNDLSCLNDIQKDLVDIVTISADYGYLALRKNLIALAYPETDTRFVSTILLIKRDNDTTINSINDLQMKRACIPEFAGKEFLAFVDTIRKLNLIENNNCEYGQIFSDFVDNSCAPGVLSTEQGNFVNVDGDKLCKQCVPSEITKTAVYCNADYINKYYGSNGSLLCLQQNNADFAVISKNSISNYDDSNIRAICRNGELSSTPGLQQIDKNCALATITDSEIVSKYNNKKNPDIILALREFERWFGQDLYAPFFVFDSFNNTLDLLFKDTTPGLDFGVKSDYVKNFEMLLDDAQNCINSGNYQHIPIIPFSIVFIIYYLFNYY